MAISVFDLFRIGIGPSSSHTVGPMRAASQFARGLSTDGLLEQTTSITVELFGSLGATGKAHGSDMAVMMGLEGESPERIDPDGVAARLAEIRTCGRLALLSERRIAFREDEHLIFRRRQSLPRHPNGMRFTARDEDGERLRWREYYSVGGGFVLGEDAEDAGLGAAPAQLPYPFCSGAELLALCRLHGCAISDLMQENERVWRDPLTVRAGLLHIWHTMEDCVARGCRQEGTLPGGMQVRRRAPDLYRRLTAQPAKVSDDPLMTMDWVNLFALAVSEENAAGGRVVTAPTNGAAGIIPAVLHYYTRFCQGRFCPGADDADVVRFLLTAGAIGSLYKENASISGAEVGCQGEVGVACSMAAAGLTEVLGGTPEQVENAAEIGMEHNLGLTCDPVGGLVQVPCIERNAMGAVKAINAAHMALSGDGRHCVSLDRVIKTMSDIGADMKTKYKETARGGLAVNVVDC